MTPETKLEAILFAEAEPLKIGKIAKWLNLTEADVQSAAANLSQTLRSRGINLIQAGDELTLATAPAAADCLAAITKSRLAADLGKAGLETIAIIAYRGPISRPEIDWIRGVNSSFILRQLLIRGLIKRETKPGDSRTYVYEPTVDLLAHLGLSQITDLPDYQSVATELDRASETISHD